MRWLHAPRSARSGKLLTRGASGARGATGAPADPWDELRRTNSAIEAALRRRVPDWSPEADAMRGRADAILVDTIDYEQIVRGALDAEWNKLTSGQRRQFLQTFSALTNHAFVSALTRRKLTQREIADRMREILTLNYPGVEFLQWPGGLVASVFSNGYLAPLVVEVSGDSLEELDAESRAVAEVARTVPGVRDIFPSVQVNYPEIRVMFLLVAKRVQATQESAVSTGLTEAHT